MCPFAGGNRYWNHVPERMGFRYFSPFVHEPLLLRLVPRSGAPKTGNWRTSQVRSNYGLYAAKMAELRAQRAVEGPLQRQLQELLLCVMKCEMQWDSRNAR